MTAISYPQFPLLTSGIITIDTSLLTEVYYFLQSNKRKKKEENPQNWLPLF